MDICQPDVPTAEAVSQFLMIDAEKVQHIRVKVMNSQLIFHDAIAVFVSGAIDRATFDSSPRHPKAKSLWIVIAAVGPLGEWSPAKFSAKHEKGGIE